MSSWYRSQHRPASSRHVSVPARILSAYGISPSCIETVSGGLINSTYLAKGESNRPALALQRLHPIFGAEVNLDIEAITDHLAQQGLVTPRLVRTGTGQAWMEDEGQIWRAITWIEGQCFGRVSDAGIAEMGAELVGRFHQALDGLPYSFRFARLGVHDTEAHMARLVSARAEQQDAIFRDAESLREQIMASIASAPPLAELPTRICHGDLKISNLLYDAEGKGLCLIDLDTMGWQNMAYELGDALRSWGNPDGEDVASPQIDDEIIAAAARGYARGSKGLLSDAEIRSVILGLETVCFELAARFCLDVFNDSYFGWDASRFASRREHNLMRARGQFALGCSVARKRESLQALWCAAF